MTARWLCVPAALLVLAGAVHAWGAERPTPLAAEAVMGLAQDLSTEALARRSLCFECHGLDEAGTGPAFTAIAGRYRDATGARAALVGTMREGGKGNWPEARGVPMPPYSGRLSRAEIEQLVDWVLGLED